ncbi:MAG: cupin domain-containing protein [Beijerinckiaceae bacterium]|nr:cupin domain-containing protein [Beijerinckiaceae bacterium]MCI0735046.1 cupin domain-containing protein [Beijerinckiaceae bacterium]
MRKELRFAGFLVFSLAAAAAWAQEQAAVKVTPLLQTTATITGQNLTFPETNPQVTATLVEIPPGAGVGWHEHPNIRYVYVIDGTLTIEMDDGSRRDFPAGTIFVEAYATRHRGMNAGTIPVKVLFIDHSEAGQSNMVKTGAPASRTP